MKRLMLAAALVALVAPCGASAASSTASLMWNLTDLYPSAEAWTAAHKALAARIEALDGYRGSLARGDGEMFEALAAISDARKAVGRLNVYAALKADEDVRIAENQERKQLAQTLASRLDEKTAWLNPEILRVGEDAVRANVQRNKELQRRFGHQLMDILRAAPHTLDDQAETVLAAAGNILAQPNAIYVQLASGNLPFPALTLSDGSKIDRLDQAAFAKYRAAQQRDDRKAVFDAFFGGWKSYEGSIGAMLNTQVLGEEFTAKARKFPDALSAALFADNMPESVYRRLVTEVNAGLPTFHRYLRLRKKLLGIKDDLAYYDMYPSMFAMKNPPRFTVEESKAVALAVTAPYGPEYAALLKKGFAGSWMNALPRQGKVPGAYMEGSAYDVHPYVLLNHNDDFDSLSTLAHEWGHAVHTMLTANSQPYENADYSMFIAETASITNEMLLSDYMVQHAKTRAEKLYYLGEALETMRFTFFRQTLFGEFQLAIHEEVEKGGALSGQKLSEIYCGLLKHYYGADQGVTKIDPSYCVEWAYIPHFYYGFYVYQYATSMAGAAAFAEAIESKKPGAQKRFIDLLKAGGSDYPYALYKKAGYDMAQPGPYRALIARMNKIMDEIEVLEKQTH